MKNLFLIILVCALNCKAQKVKGTVSDLIEPVPFVNVVVKEFKTPTIIYSYTTTDENGFYELQLPNEADSLIVEVTSPFHDIQQKNFFNNLSKSESRILNFNLQKRITSLKEVLIKAKEKPISKNGDTTNYNPSSFKDGTERVIEDLLKKLPGIKVGVDGDIKFNGKSIKKMLLDGDDLFDAQYKIGSKNISVDMVDKVQAIEDFNENTLLKGIKDSDEVAINIKLKKGKTDFSGNTKIGYGVIDRYDTSISGLVINSKNKSFGLLQYNSIGKNPSPYDIESDVILADNQKEKNEHATEIIRQGNFYSQIENQYSNLNKNLYSCLNSLFKLSTKITSRVNVGFYSDEITRSLSNSTTFKINNDIFNVDEIENLKKKPNIFNANFQLLNKSSKTHNWEYLGKIKFQNTNYYSESINNQNPQNNTVNNNSIFTKHNFNYSTLINDKNVLVISGLFSKSNSPQNYYVTPGTNIDDNSTMSIIKNEQKSEFKKELILINADLFGKYRDCQWVVKAGFSATNNKFKSSLILKDINNVTITNDNYKNNIIYDVSFPYSNIDLTLNKKRFSIKAGVGFRYYDLKINNLTKNYVLNNREILFSPDFKFTYKLSKKSSINFNYYFNQIAPKENYLFDGIVQTSYRNFNYNIADLGLLKSHNIGLSFNKYFDLLNRISAIASYSRDKNNYLNKTTINENTTITSSFLAKTNNDDYNFALSGIIYIHPIRTTIDFVFNYNINFYNDIINNSDLRNVVNKSLNAELTMRRGLKKILYFESKTIYFNSVYLLENERQNNFSSLEEAIKIAYNGQESFKANTTMSFISSDLSVNNNYFFLNSEFSFMSKNKNIEYSLIAINLTNNKTFDTFNVSDYYSSKFSQNLIERYILASVCFKF